MHIAIRKFSRAGATQKAAADIRNRHRGNRPINVSFVVSYIFDNHWVHIIARLQNGRHATVEGICHFSKNVWASSSPESLRRSTVSNCRSTFSINAFREHLEELLCAK